VEPAGNKAGVILGAWTVTPGRPENRTSAEWDEPWIRSPGASEMLKTLAGNQPDARLYGKATLALERLERWVGLEW
jgi:hypothetical protein